MRHGVIGCEVFPKDTGIWLSHPWVDFLGRSAIHTSPLITKSVVALGDQWLLCRVCVGELNERESIEFRVFLCQSCWSESYVPNEGVGLIGFGLCLLVFGLLVCLTHPPSQSFVPSVGEVILTGHQRESK